MSNQAEMDKVLDALEDQLQDEEVNEEVSQEEHIEEHEEVDDKPPGFMSYEEWVAAGKDPKKFRGEEAYKSHYDSLQEIKSLKDSVTSIAEGMAAWKESQRKQENERVARAIEEAKAELARAEEEEDVQAALRAQRNISELEKNNVNVDEPLQPNPLLLEFQRKFPIIDQKSHQFDKEFYDDMVMIQGTIIDKLTGGSEARLRALTPAQIQRSLDIAYRDAKGLHPDKFISPKNNRKSTPAPPTQKRQASTPDLRARLKGIGENRMNKNDKDPAVDMYDMLKAVDPKAAEKFALSVLGED